MQKDWVRYVCAVAALGVVAVIAVLISMSGPSAVPSSQSAPLGFPAYAPAPRAADNVGMQHGFDALASFTDNGVEPAAVTIHAGDTIRFTNNSSHDTSLEFRQYFRIRNRNRRIA